MGEDIRIRRYEPFFLYCNFLAKCSLTDYDGILERLRIIIDALEEKAKRENKM